MDIYDVIRVLFYLWLAVALGVWGYRLYRRLFLPGEDPRGSRLAADTSTSTADRTNASTTPRDRIDRSGLERPMKRPHKRFGATADDRVDDQPGDLVKAVIREELEQRRRAESGVSSPDAPSSRPLTSSDSPESPPGRSGLFARSEVPAAEGSSPTIAEALRGITLPCDLVPTISEAGAINPRRAAFVTTGFAANTVAVKLADELERLDYSIHSKADNVAIARRGSVEIRVEVFEDAATARVDGERVFPYVAAGSIGIVITN